MNISERLKMLRLAKGMTLQNAADALGRSRGNISNIETGRTTPTLDTISRLCAVYGYKVAIVFVPPDKEGIFEQELHQPSSDTDKRFK